MKSNTFQIYVEVPIEVSFTWYPAERQTKDYPGTTDHIEVDHIKYPGATEWGDIINANADRIEKESREYL